jgi:hypothetical protein
MELAEKTAALGQRMSWTKKHWVPFFSEMPLRIRSLGSLSDPSAIIPKTAENSASFSALDVSDSDKLLGYELPQGLNFTIGKPALLVVGDDV